MSQKDQDEAGLLGWVFGAEESKCSDENLKKSSQYDKHSDSDEESDKELCNNNDEDSDKDRDVCECPKPNKKEKKPKHEKKPKCYHRGPLTKNPFFNFLREFRHNTCGKSIVEIAVEGAKQWNQMTAEEKSKFKLKEIRKARNSKSKTKRNGSGTRKKDKCRM